MCNGKTASVYDYYVNSRFMMTGSVEEICKFFNMSKQALWARVNRTKKAKIEGRTTKNEYDLELSKESINEYVMFINGEFLAKGTVKEICDKSQYKRSYIDQIINGSYGKNYKKKSLIEIFKKVG